MEEYGNDEVIRHVRKSKKKTPKKSNHKHDYEILEKEDTGVCNWFRFVEVCKICGKKNNEYRHDRK